MSGGKMETTKEALILFLKSLPTGSRFEIINFGTKFDLMSNSKEGYTYDDKTLNAVIPMVQQMTADYGGTDIYRPLKDAIYKISTKLNKKIFLLTDGEVDNPDSVVKLATEAPQDIRIHTFGIGRDCDSSLVRRVASAGRGTCSLVRENKDLKSQVIIALQRAQHPSYTGVRLTINEKPKISGNSFQYNLC